MEGIYERDYRQSTIHCSWRYVPGLVMESDSVAPHCGARCIPQKVIAGTVVLPKMGTDWSISPEIVQLQLNKLNKHTQKKQ